MRTREEWGPHTDPKAESKWSDSGTWARAGEEGGGGGHTALAAADPAGDSSGQSVSSTHSLATADCPSMGSSPSWTNQRPPHHVWSKDAGGLASQCD